MFQKLINFWLLVEVEYFIDVLNCTFLSSGIKSSQGVGIGGTE